MDFEVEGDDTDSYDYDWGNDNKKVPPRKSSTSFFGGDSRADEESAYDFSYHNEAPTKKKYEPFSPAVHSYDAQPSKGGGQKAAAAPAVSAMERAQSMLDKYSGKNANAPTSNFRNQKIRTFNEDDMSMSSTDEEPSDFEMSESEDSPVKVHHIDCMFLLSLARNIIYLGFVWFVCRKRKLPRKMPSTPSTPRKGRTSTHSTPRFVANIGVVLSPPSSDLKRMSLLAC